MGTFLFPTAEFVGQQMANWGPYYASLAAEEGVIFWPGMKALAHGSIEYAYKASEMADKMGAVKTDRYSFISPHLLKTRGGKAPGSNRRCLTEGSAGACSISPQKGKMEIEALQNQLEIGGPERLRPKNWTTETTRRYKKSRLAESSLKHHKKNKTLTTMVGYKKRTPKASKGYKLAKKKYGKLRLTRGPTYSPELKYFDVEDTNPLGLDDYFIRFDVYPTMTQGTTGSTRIGNRIHVKKIDVCYKIHITTPGSLPIYGSQLTLDLWKDNDVKGDVTAPSVCYSGAQQAHDFVNPVNKSRVKRLARTVIPVEPAAVNAGVTTAIQVAECTQFTIPAKYVINYMANYGDQRDIVDNGFFIMGAAANAGAGQWCNVTALLRYWYTDF